MQTRKIFDIIFLIGESFEDDSVVLWHYVMADFPTQRWPTELHNHLKEQTPNVPTLIQRKEIYGEQIECSS